MTRQIIPYNSNLKLRARWLRNNSTLGEVILWKQLKGRKMCGYDFHRQKPINSFIVDFYCSELFLAIEVDGSSHDNKKEYDKQRQNIIENLGISFLRFTDTEVREDIESVLGKTREWIEIKNKNH